MADVFLSYSSVDRDHVAELATVLRADGLTVWWDRELSAGESFERVIRHELETASAVLVLWTEASVESEWVYSEARRSRDRGVLVQVRSKNVTLDDLPAPFDALHCPFADDAAGLVRAVTSVVHGRRESTVPVHERVRHRPAIVMVARLAADMTESEYAAVVGRRSGHVVEVADREVGARFDSAGDAVAASEDLVSRSRTSRAVVVPGLMIDGDVLGDLDAQRAGAICDAAHPGQVLLTREVAEAVPDADLELRDLGQHRFRTLPRPEWIVELVRQEATASPPLRSLGTAEDMPGAMTSFLGRTHEKDALSELLNEGSRRLVTLLGPGGVGKTRLALEVARSCAGNRTGVYFVPLDASRDAEGVWTAVASSLGVDTSDPQEAVADAVSAAVPAGTLLVLDNCEQVRSVDRIVGELLARCPQLQVLATSRSPLGVVGEQEFLLEPLDGGAAMELFAQRARLIQRGFTLDETNRADVTAICAALDGLPLAIELAAARVRILSPAALRTRVVDALDLDARQEGRPDRQRTLRATMSWSYQLLSGDARTVFRILGAFVGAARLDAVQFVARQVSPDTRVDDAIDELAASSLAGIDYSEPSRPRLRLLGTTAAYAADLLTRDGTSGLVRRALVAWGQAILTGPSGWQTIASPDRLLDDSFDLDDLHTLRGAVDATLGGNSNEGYIDAVLDVAAFLMAKARMDSLEQARERLSQAIRVASGGRPSIALANALYVLGVTKGQHHHLDQAADHLDQAAHTLDSVHGDDGASSRSGAVRFMIGMERATQLAIAGDYAAAREAADALVDLDPPPQQQVLLATLRGVILSSVGEGELALEVELEAARQARSLGSTSYALHIERNAACTLRMLGRSREALSLMESLLPHRLLTTAAADIPVLAEDYACILIDVGRVEEAARLWGAAAAAREQLRMPRPAWQDRETRDSVVVARAKLRERWPTLLRDGARRDIDELLVATVARGASLLDAAAERPEPARLPG